MTSQPLVAHSLAEAYLYLMATPCPACGAGPLEGTNAHRTSEEDAVLELAMNVTCGKCGDARELSFRLPRGTETPDAGPAYVNRSDEPSGIIDVAQWITLFHAIAEAAAKTTDKQESRRLGIEAAQCLEEALKFYDEQDNDLPPAEAFFHELSRERFRDRPQLFSRQRLVNLRAKLPQTSLMRARTAADERAGTREPKRRWWRFGK